MKYKCGLLSTNLFADNLKTGGKVYERQGIRCIKRYFIAIWQNIILDYANEPSLGICLNVNVHKPDADEM